MSLHEADRVPVQVVGKSPLWATEELAFWFFLGEPTVFLNSSFAGYGPLPNGASAAVTIIYWKCPEGEE